MVKQLERAARRLLWSWSPESERESSEAIVSNLWLHWFPAKVARTSVSWSYSLWLGAAAASLFMILTVTGVMLMFFYVPSTERAYGSIKDLQYAVSFGRLLRNQHRWAAEGMVAVVFIHMVRVFFMGAYRGSRVLNWLVGIALLLATLMLSFTGYLLPWDQLAYWAITVGTNIASEAPLLGPTARYLLLGGNFVGQQTLLRFYVLHVFFLPLLVWIMFTYHMWRARKDGGLAAIEPLRVMRKAQPVPMPRSKSYSLFGLTPGTSVVVLSSMGMEERDQVSASPNLTRRIALVFLVVFNITLLMAVLVNAPLEGPANPGVTPNPAKAPWYFVWLQELVSWSTVHLGRITISGGLLGGILVPAILLAALVAWPFLDRSPSSTGGVWLPSERTRQNTLFALIVIAIVILIMVGVYLRGPYWRLYWPWTPRPAMPRVL